MNLLAAARAAIAVLRYGRELTRAEAWKNIQAVTSLLVALLALAAAFGLDWKLSAQMVDALANGLSALVAAGVFLANAYLTWATSKRVGLPGTDPRGIDRGPPDGVGRRASDPPDAEDEAADPEADDAAPPPPPRAPRSAPAAADDQGPAAGPRAHPLPAPAPRPAAGPAALAARPRLGLAERLRPVPPTDRPDDPDSSTRPDRPGWGDRD